jgi:hypothetical protein
LLLRQTCCFVDRVGGWQTVPMAGAAWARAV